MRSPSPALRIAVIIAAVLAVAGAALIVVGRSPPSATQAEAPATPVRPVATAPGAQGLSAPHASPTHAVEPPAVPPPTWIVDKAASRLSFQGEMDGLAFDGVFRSWTAAIVFDPRNLRASHARIVVDTTSALTGQPLKDQALPSPEWLSTTDFPAAALTTRAIAQTAPGRYQALADVRIRGMLKRVAIPFTVAIASDVGRLQAVMTLDRRDFHIGEGPWRSPPPVAPWVRVTLKLVARKAS